MSYNYKRPIPLYRPRHRKRCPVCGEVSYSLAGIHPQCAARQADPNRGQTKARLMLPKQSSKAADLQRWQKACPACRAANHVRQKVCACGHGFTDLSS